MVEWTWVFTLDGLSVRRLLAYDSGMILFPRRLDKN